MRSDHADYADPDPEDVQERVRLVLAKDGAPGERNRIDGIECPNEKERALGAEPANERKTDDSHDDRCHFNRRPMASDGLI